MEHCQLQPQHSDFLEYTLKTFVMGDEYNGPIGIVKAVLNQNGKEKKCLYRGIIRNGINLE